MCLCKSFGDVCSSGNLLLLLLLLLLLPQLLRLLHLLLALTAVVAAHVGFGAQFHNSVSFHSSEHPPAQMAEPRLNQLQAATDLAYLQQMRKKKIMAHFGEALLQPVAEASEEAWPPDDEGAMLNDDEPLRGGWHKLEVMMAHIEEELRKGNIFECTQCCFYFCVRKLSEQRVCMECEPSAADRSHASSHQGQSLSAGAGPVAAASSQGHSSGASEPAEASTVVSPACWL